MNIAEFRVSTTELMGPRLQRMQTFALAMGAVGLALTLLGAAIDGKGFFHSYLYAYLFWLGVTTGSLGLLALHHTVGGGWGFLIRRFLEAATRLLLPMLVLALPVFLGIHELYEWSHTDVVQSDPILLAKSGYLNTTGFIVRTVIYFAIWFILASTINRWAAVYDERADLVVFNRLNVLGAVSIILYVLSVTFFIVDFVMSLTPHWYSSIFGLLTVVTQGLATLALMVVLLAYLVGDEPLLGAVPSGYFRDLGNLTLACVMLWAYMSFSQYLIQYSGNTVEDVGWYVQRRNGGWGIISMALIPLHFFLPFMILLVGSRIKRSPKRLARVMVYLILMRFLDLFWWVTPTFRPQLSVSVTDFGTPLLIGGIWLWLWAGQMKDRPLLPLHDPRLEGAFADTRGHAEVVSHG